MVFGLSTDYYLNRKNLELFNTTGMIEKYNQDYYYLDTLYENINDLPLNIVHSKEFEIKYWRIIVGPWLRFL